VSSKDIQAAQKAAEKAKEQEKAQEKEQAPPEPVQEKPMKAQALDALNAFEKAWGAYMEKGEELAAVLTGMREEARFKPASMARAMRLKLMESQVSGLELLRGMLSTTAVRGT